MDHTMPVDVTNERTTAAERCGSAFRQDSFTPDSLAR
jgi:hypothetical protein